MEVWLSVMARGALLDKASGSVMMEGGMLRNGRGSKSVDGTWGMFDDSRGRIFDNGRVRITYQKIVRTSIDGNGKDRVREIGESLFEK